MGCSAALCERSGPIAQASHARAPRIRTAGNVDGGGLTLYVEDNPANVRFMEDVVSTFDNVELLTAPTAEIGLDYARNRLPVVIVMDKHAITSRWVTSSSRDKQHRSQ